MTYSKTRRVAIATGVALLATSAGLNVVSAKDGGAPAIVAIIAVAIATVVAVPAALYAWREKRWALAILTLVLLVAGEGFNGFNSFERLLAALEARASVIATGNAPYQMASERLQRAEQVYRDANAAAVAEAHRGGCRRVCRDLQALAETARQDVEDARALFARASPPRSEHLVVDFTGLSASTIEIGVGLAFSVVLNGLGLALLAIGSHGGSIRSVQQRSRSRPAKSSKRRRRRRIRKVQSAPCELAPEPRFTRRAEVQSFVETFRIEQRRNPRFSEVQKALGLPKATASAYRRLAPS